MRFAQIVLSAGRSSRMGSPKANLELGGKTSLERTIGAARAGGVRRHLVVVGEHAREIRERHEGVFDFEGIHWVENADSRAPMASSLKLALSTVEPAKLDGFFFLPVDLPLITARVYKALIEAFKVQTDELCTLVPVHAGRRGHPPLCTGSLLKAFLELDADQTPRDVISKHPRVEVSVSDFGIHEDMDTPEDFQRLKARLENGTS